MNFNYSYRSFLITALLFGILYLGLYSIKLSNFEEESLVKYDVEYIPEEIIEEILEEKDLAINEASSPIETNKAYNEAEKRLKDFNATDNEPPVDLDQKLAELDAAIAEANAQRNAIGIQKANEKLKETKEKLEASKKKNAIAKGGSSRKTTMSYRLVDRKALFLPNPVYICNTGGTIVISIEVNLLGKVEKATFNKSLSTTTNGCLIDSAIEYALQARFNTSGNAADQLGTITYNFPGQQ